jgi:hypothetical protein
MDFAPVTKAGAFYCSELLRKKEAPAVGGRRGFRVPLGGTRCDAGESIANPYLMRFAVMFITCRCGNSAASKRQSAS